MSRSLKFYIAILITLFVGVIVVELSSPSAIDWRKNFRENNKSPFGTFIFYNELEAFYPDVQIEEIDITPYEFFDYYYDWDEEEYLTSGTYFYLDNAMMVDDVSAQELLDFASHGNDIFISSTSLPYRLIDSLGVSLNSDFDFGPRTSLNLVNPRLKEDSIILDRGFDAMYFSGLDPFTTTVLGKQKFGTEERVNFIKVAHGDGYFYLHLQPIVFTNYYLLKDKNYAEGVLSYLDPDLIFYDTRNRKRQNLSSSKLRFINQSPALRWGFYLGLIALLVFIVFNAKRKQRVVPVLKPEQNTTVEFTKTISNLYYETRDHNTIIEKKITYFLEYIRRVYFLDTDRLDEKFISALSSKSGKKLSLIKKLINLITYLRSKPHCVEDDLLNLNKLIEEFFN